MSFSVRLFLVSRILETQNFSNISRSSKRSHFSFFPFFTCARLECMLPKVLTGILINSFSNNSKNSPRKIPHGKELRNILRKSVALDFIKISFPLYFFSEKFSKFQKQLLYLISYGLLANLKIFVEESPWRSLFFETIPQLSRKPKTFCGDVFLHQFMKNINKSIRTTSHQ